MKYIILLIIFILSITMVLEAYDFNMDFESDLLYTRYRNNPFSLTSVFFLINDGSNQLTPVSSFEEINLKLKDQIEQVNFNIDTRFYVYPQTETVSYVIDNAYFSYAQGPFIVYAGKQRIKWGVGYTWNPSDLLQPVKNILDPTRYLEGIYAVRMEYSSDFITPSVIIAPTPQNNDNNLLGNLKLAWQLYKLIGTADVFLNSIYEQNQFQTIGSAVSWDTGLFVLNLEGVGIQYQNAALNLLRALDREDSKTIKFNYLIGVSKSANSDFFLTLEYYRNNWGMDNAQFDSDWNKIVQNPDYASLISYGIKKDYLALETSYTWRETLEFEMAAISGLDDNSFMLYPRITYIISSNFDILFGIFENFSKPQNVEGYQVIPIIDSIELRLRAYF